MKVKLLSGLYTTEDWEGTFEVDTETRLLDFAEAIRHALRFDDDHMFEFYVARTPRSHPRTTYDDENGHLYDTTLGSLYPLPADRNLYYLYDYGDCWLFRIVRGRQQPSAPKPRAKYPRLISWEGKKPQQYPTSDF